MFLSGRVFSSFSSSKSDETSFNSIMSTSPSRQFSTQLQAMQEKYADALEKKQKYMDEAMDLREKRSGTMETMASIKQEKIMLAEEISALKTQLSAAGARQLHWRSQAHRLAAG